MQGTYSHGLGCNPPGYCKTGWWPGPHGADLVSWGHETSKLYAATQDPDEKLGFFTECGRDWSEQRKLAQSPKGSAKPG